MQSLGKNGCGLSILTARNTDYTPMFLDSTVAIIIAVAVVGILLLRKRAQTWRCLEGAEKALKIKMTAALLLRGCVLFFLL